MRPMFLMPTIALAMTLVAGCGGNTESTKVSGTQIGDLESVKGTISDDMINTDESTDEAPIDAPAPVAAPSKNEKSKAKLDPAQVKETGGPLIVKVEPEPAPE